MHGALIKAKHPTTELVQLVRKLDMQENHKTLTFVLVAAMAALVAWEPWRPPVSTDAPPEEVGTKLFPDFKDPLAAKSLEVVTL